ncbi:MAG: hypothetical protein ABR543_18415 [Gemmatimonadaceae bacterium]
MTIPEIAEDVSTVRPYRPPIGLPLEKQSPWAAPISVLLHALVVALIFLPILISDALDPAAAGAGGRGPMGGGGGGRLGSGGAAIIRERLQYVVPAPVPEQPTPEVTPPVTPEAVEPTPTEAIVDLKIEAPSTEIDMALTRGTGGGTGNDGTNGNGPGTGGGVGSGVGTGRGSSVGPGTGGGDGLIYPPVPVHFFLPPLPAPERIKPYHTVAQIDVDSTGRILGVRFSPSKDGSYNRRLNEVLHQLKFRPATTQDGVPVRATALVDIRIF